MKMAYLSYVHLVTSVFDGDELGEMSRTFGSQTLWMV